MKNLAFLVAVSLLAPQAWCQAKPEDIRKAGQDALDQILGPGALQRAQQLPPPPVIEPKEASRAQQGGGDRELAKAKDELQKIVRILETQVEDETLSDKAKIELYKALASARKALAAIEGALAQGNSGSQLDERIAEARFIQKVLSGYLGTKEFFGYRLKEGPIVIEVGGDIIYERIARKVPFLGGAVGGRVRINPREAIVTQFNSLKAEFYGALVEAAHLNKNDNRLKALAKWGGDTKVLYPGGEFNGEPILTTQQVWDLDR